MKKQYIALSILVVVIVVGAMVMSQKAQAPTQEKPIVPSSNGVSGDATPAPVSPKPPVTAVPKPTPAPTKTSLTTKPWVWTKTQYSDDAVVTSKSPDKFVLTFKADNTFSLSTDCNGVGGNYTVKENTITFSDMISTQMFCEDSQEQAVTTMLTNTQSYLFTDTGNLVLVLKLDTGSMFFK